jgi:hypothetical protein
LAVAALAFPQTFCIFARKLRTYKHFKYDEARREQEETVEQELNDEQLDKATGGSIGKKGLTTT